MAPNNIIDHLQQKQNAHKKQMNKPKKDLQNHKITKRKAQENLAQLFNKLDQALKKCKQNQIDLKK